MTDLELIFSMLGEAARGKLEIETGDKVVNPENYLDEPESVKRLKR